MKCISLWQPWGSALFLTIGGRRLKVHETRSWAPPPALIGERVGIHAALRLEREVGQTCDDLLTIAQGPAWRHSLTRGALLGDAILADCRAMDGSAAPEHDWDEAFGDWGPGRYAWRLEQPRLYTPIPMPGKQGWFEVHDSLLPKLEPES